MLVSDTGRELTVESRKECRQLQAIIRTCLDMPGNDMTEDDRDNWEWTCRRLADMQRDWFDRP